jgi:hypothetical protein
MTRDEMVTLARRMDTADGTEQELDAIMIQLMKELPHGDILTLLFHTRPQLTAEEAVDEALRREAAWRLKSEGRA